MSTVCDATNANTLAHFLPYMDQFALSYRTLRFSISNVRATTALGVTNILNLMYPLYI